MAAIGSAILAAHRAKGNQDVAQLFTRKELVGKGAYGGVYKGIHNDTGTVVALKVIDLDTPDDDISEIQREVALLSELRDAARYNITLYHGSYLHGHELWIAMDFASGGSIRTLMKSGPIEEKYAALIIREVLVALSFLHRQGIIHRDVKAANVLLTQTGKILLCDFGVAAHLQTNSKRSTFTGTPLWMAPEVITDGKLYDTQADVWSLGITLYEIATGNPPHFGMEPLRACALIPTMAPPRLEGGSWSNGMREFLASCLEIDPSEVRPLSLWPSSSRLASPAARQLLTACRRPAAPDRRRAVQDQVDPLGVQAVDGHPARAHRALRVVDPVRRSTALDRRPRRRRRGPAARGHVRARRGPVGL
ncbi:uncharacterized protein RHOBADRAFT_17325 [Rhodotorula graminis WP1]|uniref:non-specific serine/threonine protein kinase n=1 Tax=Rhodotorula graminis (strain WP1) TaxID=578459 RepID=A0A0P9GZW3_RHOGW|nr:uncharacterized protein RHOBADRAFT_17325 [Rhodotorula graminis WP1]KPV72977.1 hypothetical protein RHOBADRAFT_17325 [Rhodotorula graminis WP1]